MSVDNDALFKCLFPPQTRDFYQVTGWLEDGQHLVTAAGQNQNQNSNQPQAKQTLVLPDGQLYLARVQLRDANKSFRCQYKNLLNSKVSLSALSGRLFVTGKFISERLSITENFPKNHTFKPISGWSFSQWKLASEASISSAQ